MRMLLKWELGLEGANEAIRTGTMEAINKTLFEQTQPEAAYFGTENGRRTAYIFFDLTDVALIPVIAEPLFRQVQSTVEFIPVMNVEELQQGLAQAGQA